MEIAEQVDDIDAVVIPVGGGGLIAGCSVALKALHPNIEIIVSFFCTTCTITIQRALVNKSRFNVYKITMQCSLCTSLLIVAILQQGVESEKCASFAAAMKAGQPVKISSDQSLTLADGK